MKVGAAGSGGSTANQPVRPQGDNGEIKMLEKQKALLLEKKQKISESKEDVKTKSQKIQEVQAQIDEIDAAIQQKRNEKLSQVNGSEGASAENDAKRDPINNLKSEGQGDRFEKSALTQVAATYSQVQTVMKVKKELVHRGNILKVEIAFDERTGSPAKLKRAELAKVNRMERKLDQKTDALIEKTHKQLEEAAKPKSKEEEDKDKEKAEPNRIIG